MGKDYAVPYLRIAGWLNWGYVRHSTMAPCRWLPSREILFHYQQESCLSPHHLQRNRASGSKKAQDPWNTKCAEHASRRIAILFNSRRNPKIIAQAKYTPESFWCNRASFIVGTLAIEGLPTKK
ncbi:hypothetical protein BDU57DRAFT_251684 [Ampelomyces quisqualis]|uniref:Uncharacterized protein n=1 Tax=Ampelomyces quisqualis TaxID=50730 RepID=A0A6A5QMV7_AMPQU|nr:hypothetical protein BDU57DRAFT_251684 [Ampelomyces quisqualis]